MKRYIKSSNDMYQSIDLGPVEDLPRNKLLQGVEGLELKDMEPYQGKIVYVISTTTYGNQYRLTPIEVIYYDHTPGRRGYGKSDLWGKLDEYSIGGVIPGTNSEKWYSTSDPTLYPPFSLLFTPSEANKIKSNAEAILNKRSHLNY